MERPICETITGGRCGGGHRYARGKWVKSRLGVLGEGIGWPGKPTQDSPDGGGAIRPKMKSVRWEAARREATGLLSEAVRRTLTLRAGCQQPVRRYVEAVEVPDALRLVCTGFRSGTWGSSARPLHRITQPKGTCPSWETVRRAGLNPMRPDPGRGPDPPGFSARNPGKSLTTEPIIAGAQRCCNGFGASRPQLVSPL